MVLDDTKLPVRKKFWKQQIKDGHYWNTNWSGWQDLNGLQHLCKCHGSLKCTNKKCSTFEIHCTANRRSFALIGWSNYKCKICGQLAEGEWCGAKQAIEFNHDTKILFGMKENTIASSSTSQFLRKRKKQRKTF